MADKKITSFKITVDDVPYKGVINETAHTVTVTLPYGTTIGAFSPVITVSSGATVSPASGVATSFATVPVTYTVTASDSTTQAYAVTVLANTEATVKGVHNLRVPGWSNVRCIVGDLDSYTSGGVDLGLRDFIPKYVIGVQVDNGFTGYYDIDTKKLKVFKSVGVEATSVANVNYTVMLMGE